VKFLRSIEKKTSRGRGRSDFFREVEIKIFLIELEEKELQ
jgi:hypothetical protein